MIARCCWRVRSPPVAGCSGRRRRVVVDPGLAVDRVHGDMPDPLRIFRDLFNGRVRVGQGCGD